MTEALIEPSRIKLRDLDPRVPRLFLGFGFSALGSGLTMPFLFVYLAEVRGFSTASVGTVFAWMGLLGALSAPVGGTFIDRFGPRPVMLAGLSVEACATASIGLVSELWQAFALSAVMVLGTVALWPATTAMLTRLVPSEVREKVYGVNFMLLNTGLGVGGAVAALTVDVHSVASFQRLYLIDGCSYLGYLLVLLRLPVGTGAADAATEAMHGAREHPSWGLVLRDRALVRVVLISVLAVTFGYAQMEAGFAAYAVTVSDVPAWWLGWAFAANTGAIVLGQLPTLRLIRGRRRSAMLAVCAGTWSVSWVVIVLSDALDPALAVTAIVVGLAVFGLGETLWAPLAPAIVNDLARDDLRGRYNALQGMTWTVGSIVGPMTAGLLIGHAHPYIWAVCVVAGTALAGVLFLDLRRHLTPAQDGLRRTPVAA